MTKISKYFKGIMFLTAVVGMTVLLLPDGSYAARYKVFCDKDLFVNGFIRQNVDVGLHAPVWTASDPDGNSFQMSGHDESAMQMLNTVFLETRFMWSDKLEFRFGGRFESDLIDHFHDNNDVWNNGSGQAFNVFQDVNDLESDEEINDMIRELTVAYFAKYFTFRLGKQQLGWGESDGLRLMDQINALDLRRDFIMRDSDEGYWETRIPLWMARLDLAPAYGFGSALGFNNLDLELSWIPDVHQENRFGIGPRDGGPWAFPLPDIPLPLKQLNLAEDYPNQSTDNGTFATRLKGMFLGTFFTINGYYGWQKNFVVEHSGLGLGGTQVGTAGLLLTGLNWDGEGNVGDSSDITETVTALYGLPAGSFPAGTFMGGLSLDWYKKLERKKFIGFTLSRELQSVRPVANFMGQTTLPVIRVEALYDKDVPFNLGSQANAGTFEMLSSNWIWSADIVTRDIYRYLIGLDWNTHCKYINPNDDVFVSVQFSQNIMDQDVEEPNAVSGVPAAYAAAFPGLGGLAPAGVPQRLCMAPYAWFPEKTETFASLLVKSEYWHCNLIPQILYVGDLTYNSFWIKSKIDYKLRDTWRFELGYTMIHGAREQQFGLFEQSDYLFGMVKYLF